MADLARRALRLERRMWSSLGRWLVRRPDVPAGASGFRYAGPVTPILWTFVILSVIETVAFHLVLPWEVVRLVVDVVSVYGLIWMVGLLAAHRVRPHVVGDAGLRLRDSLFADVSIPWEDVAAVRRRRGLTGKDARWDGTVLTLAVSGQTNLEVELTRPTLLTGAGSPPADPAGSAGGGSAGGASAGGESAGGGPARPGGAAGGVASVVRFHADDPAAMERAIAGRLAAAGRKFG